MDGFQFAVYQQLWDIAAVGGITLGYEKGEVWKDPYMGGLPISGGSSYQSRSKTDSTITSVTFELVEILGTGGYIGFEAGTLMLIQIRSHTTVSEGMEISAVYYSVTIFKYPKNIPYFRL